MINELTKKESKREAVGLTKIATIINLVLIANSGNYVKLAKSLTMSD
jgi:hypothetical protein